MRAAYYDSYGPADTVSIRDLPRPEPGAQDVLVRVRASSVTTADWRLRASAFDGGLWLPGRLMTGLIRPRRRVLGHDFAGEVVSVGASVTRFAVGDRVMGHAQGGAHAEFLAIDETGPVVTMPRQLSFEEAAATPFGALAALVFLRDVARVRAGERVLVHGASGGVGVFLVQIARLIGAEVTAVASTANQELLTGLGANRVIDYTRTAVAETGLTVDVVVDTVGRLSFRSAARLLSPNGRFVPIEFGLGTVALSLWTGLVGGRRVITRVSGDTREDLQFIADRLAEGAIRPVIDSAYPLEDIVHAHRRVESRHKRGSVVVTVAAADQPLRRAA